MRQRRYPSDTSIGEWALLEPLLPTPACQLPTGGHPEKWPRRAIVDAIRYVVDTGCKWRALPADFPPFQTVFGFFSRWRAAGIFNLIRDQFRRQVRRAMGASPHPVAAAIDSQSVKVAATVPRSTSGFDPGKKIPGRKRHIVCDMKGLLLFVMVTPADTHDAVAAKEVLLRVRLMHPQIAVVWADSIYGGTLTDWAKSFLNLTIKTVSRPEGARGFVLLPRRWVVERSLAWWLHARRNARDYETRPEHSEAMLTLAAITLR
jgi:transposase